MSRNRHRGADARVVGKHRSSKKKSSVRRAAVLAASAAGALVPVAVPAAAHAEPVLLPDHHTVQAAGSAAAPQAVSSARALLSMRHPAVRQRPAVPATYVVRSGDTLSSIAEKLCGSYRDWLGIWHATGHMPDPNLIFPGRELTIACNANGPGYVPPAPVVTTAAPVYHEPVYHAPADNDSGYQAPVQQYQAPAAQPQSIAPASYNGGGGFQSCVISRESGGNSQVMNASGHYGLYQFSESTWVSHGGSPGDFGHASVAEQNQVFENTYAADGTSDWAPYDGC